MLNISEQLKFLGDLMVWVRWGAGLLSDVRFLLHLNCFQSMKGCFSEQQ